MAERTYEHPSYYDQQSDPDQPSDSEQSIHSDESIEDSDSEPRGDESIEDSDSEPRGPKKQVEFDDNDQPIGDNAAAFVTFVGKKTRLQCSPNYEEWPLVPIPTKEFIWKIVRREYELEDKRKVIVLLKANTAWKNWKYKLRLAFDEFLTDSERRKNRPTNVKPDDWIRFIQQCHTKEEKAKRKHGKSVRRCVKLPHTSGRRGAARTKQDLMKQSESGEVTRTELFVALHTKKDGSCPFPEARTTLDAIKQVVTLCPSSVHRDLDNDPVAEVCGRDGNRNVRGYPSGVSKTVLHVAAPYKKMVQREKRKREDTEEKFKLLVERLDEESRARKILEQKLASHFSSTSEFGNANQERCSTPLGEEPQTMRSSSNCLLKNFRKVVVAQGYVRMDTQPCEDSYMVRIDDIFEPTTQLYEREGILGDITIGSSIQWHQSFVKMI